MGRAPRVLSGWVPGNGESEFSSDQLNLLLALAEIEADAGPYGQSIREATSEDANLGRTDGLPPRYYYRAEDPIVNYAVRAVEEAQAAFQKSLPQGADMPKGLLFPVRKVTVGGSS